MRSNECHACLLLYLSTRRIIGRKMCNDEDGLGAARNNCQCQRERERERAAAAVVEWILVVV